MKVVCSWCQRVISEGPDGPASHGICPDCAEGLDPSGYSVIGRSGPIARNLTLEQANRLAIEAKCDVVSAPVRSYDDLVTRHENS